MKLKSIVKYNLNSLKNGIAIYYAIFITVCVVLTLLSKNSNGTISSSGLEMSSAIFIFVVGLNSFKEKFYFMKSNNVSRKDFLYGTAISMMPVVLFMSFIDIIINRIYNIFIKSPTSYEMIYTNLRNSTQWSIDTWVQSNSIETLFNTFIFQAAVYLAFFALGFLITIIYYKCNNFMKVVVSVIPVALIMILNVLVAAYPSFARIIFRFIETMFGWNTQNSYIAVLTFIVLYIILIGVSRLLTRKAIIRQS